MEIDDENINKFLLNKKLYIFNNFKEAIEFLTSAKNKYQEHRLEFSYFIAKTAIENNLELSKGKSNLKYCKKHFSKNWYFTKDDLEGLE